MESFAGIFSNAWALALVVIFFGGSIFVHEFGHYLAAKWRGMKVVRFSIGFGPKIYSRMGKDGCEYAVSLLPLGGYVALPQIADLGAIEGESGACANLPKASCADKIIVGAAGALFNIVFAVFLAAAVWIAGIEKNAAYETTVIGYIPETIADIDGAEIPSPAKKAGLREGDKILSIDGSSVKNFAEIAELVAVGSGRGRDGKPSAALKIERGGKILDITVSPELLKTNLATGDEIRAIGVSPAMEIRVGAAMKGSPAEAAGLMRGDVITELGGKKLFSNGQLGALLDALPSGAAAKITVMRGGEKLEKNITPKKIALTKPLLRVCADAGSEASFFISNSQDPKSARGIPKVLSAKGAAFSAMSAGDMLCSVNGETPDTLEALKAALYERGRNNFSLARAQAEFFDVPLSAPISAKIEPPKTKAMLGISIEPATRVFHPSIAEQFADSISRTCNALSGLVAPTSDIGIKSLAGPVDIGRVIYQLSLTDFMLVLSFAVLLNVNLAILNLLPLPVLDGGHILLAVLEKIRGKPVPSGIVVGLHLCFTLALLSLMLYIVYSGFMRWEGDSKFEAAESAVAEFYIKDIKF